MKLLKLGGANTIAASDHKPFFDERQRQEFNREFGAGTLGPGMRRAHMGISSARFVNIKNMESMNDVSALMDKSTQAFFVPQTVYAKTVPGVRPPVVRPNQQESAKPLFCVDMGFMVALEADVYLQDTRAVSTVEIVRGEHQLLQIRMGFWPTYAALDARSDEVARARVVGHLKFMPHRDIIIKYLNLIAEHGVMGDPKSVTGFTEWIAASLSLRAVFYGENVTNNIVTLTGAKLLNPGPRIRANEPIGRTK